MSGQNLRLGHCTVNFNGVDLGLTKDGCTITVDQEFADVTADKWGNTPYDRKILGQTVTVTVSLAEAQIDQLAVAFPMGTVTGATSARFEFGNEAGKSLRAEGAKLILHPNYNLVTNVDEDWTFHKAVVSEVGDITLNNEDQTVYEVTFTAMIDDTKDNGNLLFYFGDSTD